MNNNNEIAKIPTISEITFDKYMDGDKNMNELQKRLNCNPPSSFIAEHPMTNIPYIPIEKVEYMLTRIFGKWSVEIKSYQLIANSVAVCIRLFYRNPLTQEIEFQDGIGAQQLQTDKGAGATDFNAIKSAAVSMALPSAESFAVKDAAEKIGKLFGKDIGRKSTMNYEKMFEEKNSRIDQRAEKALEDDKTGDI